MVIKKITIVLLFFVYLASGCQKDEESPFVDIRSDEKELVYQETQCSDPWYEYYILNKDKNISKAMILGEFLESREIFYVNLIYKKESSDNIVSCTACQCFTGAVYYIRIKDKEETVSALQELGFKLLK